MKLEIHVHVHNDFGDLSFQLTQLKEEIIMATQAQNAAALQALLAQLQRAKAEILTAINNPAQEVTSELQAAVDALMGIGQELDDVAEVAPPQP